MNSRKRGGRFIHRLLPRHVSCSRNALANSLETRQLAELICAKLTCRGNNAIVFSSSEEEIAGLIEKHLSQDGARLMGIVELVETVPVLTVSNFDCIGFVWNSPNILHVSGRVYYEDE